MVLLTGRQALGEKAKGPLRVHPTNPRYFTDGSGNAICLTGSHTARILPVVMVHGAEAGTGRRVYEQRLEGAGEICASPVLADGKLYYLTHKGRTFVLAAGPRFEQLAVNDLGDSSLFNASPAVAGDRLFLRSDRFLYCIGEK